MGSHRAFSAFVLQKIFDTSAQDAASAVVDNYEDNGIDAIYFDRTTMCLALVQSKLHATEDFKQEDAQEFIAGVKLLLRQQFDTFNQNVQDRINDIERYLDDCRKILLVASCTGNQFSKHARVRLDDYVKSLDKEDERLLDAVTYIDAEKVTEWLIDEQTLPKVNATLKIEKSQKTTEPRLMVHGIISLQALVSLHNNHKKALYEKNIRYFLGTSTSEVNSAIQNTLSSKPEDFLYLNNGVTAICDDIFFKNPNSKTITHEVRGVSIVNGAQTIATAAEFMGKNQDSDISAAKVMLTLIHAPESGDFHKKVTKARNFQNPVHISNFISLDERQELIRKKLRLHDFDYHYRPEAAVNGTNAITIEEATAALACLLPDLRHAVWLKSEPLRYKDQESDYYKAIFGNDITGIKLINAVKCYKLARSLVKEYELGADNKEKIIYRHAANVMVGTILKRLTRKIDSQIIVDEENIQLLISSPLDLLRAETIKLYENSHAAELGPLSFFRNVTFGTELALSLLSYQANLSDVDKSEAEKIRNTKKIRVATNNSEEATAEEKEYHSITLVRFIVSKTKQL